MRSGRAWLSFCPEQQREQGKDVDQPFDLVQLSADANAQVSGGDPSMKWKAVEYSQGLG